MIVKSLNHDPAGATRDIEKSITLGHGFGSMQGMTQAFLKSQQLKTWLTCEDSEVLLVNGNSTGDKVSPLTFACGIFTRSLSSFSGAIRICFFCGMHCDPRKEEEPGAGLMLASLISQLLAGYSSYKLRFSQGWRFKAADLESDSPNRIDALLELFSQLMMELPENQIVFCIIDGIQFYENHSRGRDTNKAIRHLVDLVLGQDERQKSHTIFKLLITTPSKSTGRIVDRKKTWSMPSDIGRSPVQGFNIKRQLAEKEREMRKMENADGSSHIEGDWHRYSSSEEKSTYSTSEE